MSTSIQSKTSPLISDIAAAAASTRLSGWYIDDTTHIPCQVTRRRVTWRWQNRMWLESSTVLLGYFVYKGVGLLFQEGQRLVFFWFSRINILCCLSRIITSSKHGACGLSPLFSPSRSPFLTLLTLASPTLHVQSPPAYLRSPLPSSPKSSFVLYIGPILVVLLRMSTPSE